MVALKALAILTIAVCVSFLLYQIVTDVSPLPQIPSPKVGHAHDTFQQNHGVAGSNGSFLLGVGKADITGSVSSFHL